MADEAPTDDPSTDASQPSATQRGAHAASGTTNGRWIVEMLVVLVVAAALVFGLRVFVIGIYSIPSASMEPTLMVGDRIVVDKLSYHLHGVDRSNIVVFSRPSDEDCGGTPVANLVKRVIGLPGETISLSGGQVYINGKPLAEPWLPASVQRSTTPGPGSQPYALHKPFKVPAHDVFVMGDNREDSCDSRYWGPIPESTIVGQVDVRIWPVTRLHWF